MSVTTPSRPPAPAPTAPPSGEAQRARSSRGILAGRAATSVLLWTYAAVAVGPLLLMVVNSLRPSRDVLARPVALPLPPSAAGYTEVFTDGGFLLDLRNSLVVVIAAVVLGTVVSVLAAYPLGRYAFRGSRFLALYFLSGLMLPIRLAVLPLFYLLASLSLVDSHLGIVLVYGASGVPFSVFVLTAFFRGLPRELEEAARIDGAGEWQIFARVMLPLVRPALATVVVFQFVPLWNDFFYQLVLLRSPERATIQVALTEFFGQYQTDWAALFAVLVLATLPLVLLFVAATRQIVAGLTAGIGK